MAVLMGAPRANKIAQSWVNDITAPLKIDGIIGNMSLGYINETMYIYDNYCTDCNEVSFLDHHIKIDSMFDSLKLKYAKYYLAICNKDLTQDENLKGWLNRVLS